MADKNFYGMALQLQWRYDRLVHQKKQDKKRSPKGPLTCLDSLHRDAIIVKISLDIVYL